MRTRLDRHLNCIYPHLLAFDDLPVFILKRVVDLREPFMNKQHSMSAVCSTEALDHLYGGMCFPISLILSDLPRPQRHFVQPVSSHCYTPFLEQP